MPGVSVAENLRQLEMRIAAACARAHRPRASVNLLAVSKTQNLNKICTAVECGQIDFAENYVQEAQKKMSEWAGKKIRWHFIGRIQSNKLRQLAELKFSAIHSFDRAEHVIKFDQWCGNFGIKQNIFLQFNVAGEESKAGAGSGDIPALAECASQCTNINVLGLMVMPPLVADPELSRPHFAQARVALKQFAREWGDKHSWSELSMGTSHDFAIAIEEGATWIRIGTDIFGPREEKQ